MSDSLGRDGGGEDDFAGYVAARWPELVRTLVLLGCPERLAADVALDALGRCQRGWSRAERSADVDDLVRGELLAAWDRRRAGRDPWWRSPAPTGTPGSTDSTGSTDALGELDRLDPAARAELVCDPSSGVAAVRLRAATALLAVLAPPTSDQITSRRRTDTARRTRRGVRIGLAIVVPVLLIAAGITWITDREPPASTALAPLPVRRADNPTNVVWEAGGVVHLARTTIAVPPLQQLAPFGNGVIYADSQGRVVRLDDDGARTVLGREETDLGFVSSDARGWVAWVDPTDNGRRLVVADAVADKAIGSLAVDADTHPVAIDEDTVYLADDVGVRGWQPLSATRPDDAVEPADLVAAAARTRVYQTSQTVLRVAPYGGENLSVIGIGASLSTNGRLLVTRTSGRAGGDGPVAVYDTITAAVLQSGVAGDELALDASLGPDLTVTYLIARKADRPTSSDQLRASFAGALQLRTCALNLADVAPTCRLITEIPVSGVVPQLAH